jgi:dephospho-CoA kinase
VIDNTKVRLLGVTGPIACGKSTVAQMAVDHGAIDHIDADRVTHDLMRSGAPLTQAIAREFGPSVVTADQAVDRKALGAIVFACPDRLRVLERLVHPEVRRAVVQRIIEVRKRERQGTIVLEAVKLLESPLLGMTDAVWLVVCSTENQRTRLLGARGQSGSEAENRIAAQPPFDVAHITAVIEHNGSLQDLARRVDREWSHMLELPGA